MNKLKKYLKEHDVGRNELFNEIKRLYPKESLTKAQISRIKNGQVTNYSIFTLIRICTALGVTPNDIVDYEDDKKI